MDDGGIPPDNPFVPGASPTDGVTPAFERLTIWSYGHRNPQGLEFNPQTGELWSAEMGPRGGDEINLLLPGRNYGWPLHSSGVDYDGTPVEYGRVLGIDFSLDDLEQPVVDLSPAPAVPSFVIYNGTAFPEWRGDLIVGSLKAAELYRVTLDEDGTAHKETLLSKLARIRDIEVGHDGLIHLLLEHPSGGMTANMLPE